MYGGDMNVLHGMVITAKTDDVLDSLRKNREVHSQVVVEARNGFADKAEEALKKRMVEVREGKIRHLMFSLKPPQDHTNVYDTAIQMLELHVKTSDTIELDNSQVRTLVMDKWDWSEQFWGSNKAYSGTAQAVADQLGY